MENDLLGTYRSKELNGYSKNIDFKICNVTKDVREESNEQKYKYGCQNLISDELLVNTMRLLDVKIECQTLNDLTEQLRRVFENDNVNVEYVHSLMSAYKSNPAEWLKFAKFDKYRYTRNLVDSGNGKYNLMVLCWGEGHGSSIHDHSNSNCFMKMLAGSLCEIRFKWPDKQNDEVTEESAMTEISRNVLNTDEVCYINDSMGLHRVENLSYADRAVSLHLYCPPFNSCYVFNQTTGHKIKAPVTFWSLFGERCSKRSRNKDRDSSPEDN